MNAETFMDLMNTLPDEMLVTAYKKRFSPYTEEESESAFFSASDRTVTQKRSDASVKHPPRWITAAALAACMLFAVGVGAMLLRGQRDDLTTQSSLADSSVQTFMTASSETSINNETLTQTNTTFITAKVSDVDTVPAIVTNEPLAVTAANIQPQKTENMTTTVQSVTQTTETTSIPEAITTTVFQGDFSSKDFYSSSSLVPLKELDLILLYIYYT